MLSLTFRNALKFRSLCSRYHLPSAYNSTLTSLDIFTPEHEEMRKTVNKVWNQNCDKSLEK